MPELSKTLGAALNEQVKRELDSAYLYLSMSVHCDAMGFKGCAHWLRVQCKEEASHGLKIVDYLMERGHPVALKVVDQPESEFGSLVEVFEKVLGHEKEVTASIYTLCDLAAKEKDYASQAFLQWYVTEQVEEESTAQGIVDTLKLAGVKGTALLMVDRRLAERASP